MFCVLLDSGYILSRSTRYKHLDDQTQREIKIGDITHALTRVTPKSKLTDYWLMYSDIERKVKEITYKSTRPYQNKVK